MGISTVAIGLLPSYEQIGLWAPILLCLSASARASALGGEWGGAALVATENAPGRQARLVSAAFPQLGAPIGLFTANGVFFLVSYFLGPEAMVAWGWRIPFLLSVVLVGVGLLCAAEPAREQVFREAEAQGKKLHAPVSAVLRQHADALLMGIGWPAADSAAGLFRIDLHKAVIRLEQHIGRRHDQDAHQKGTAVLAQHRADRRMQLFALRLGLAEDLALVQVQPHIKAHADQHDRQQEGDARQPQATIASGPRK